jgi:ribonuclease VapC
MIVVDSSALIAILENEPDAATYAAVLRETDRLLLSTVNLHETATVLRIRRGASAVLRLWRFLQIENDFEIVPFDEVQARAAISAFERYGKGINAESRLNLADCAAYALAKTMNVPLLFKGDDFSHTDLQACL